ncbi:hypothetical protein Shyhy02_51950 [Streptomyces hygroscopicus subsp. hygroscopicus]|nr:hypothetical protein Shyhy02_51950 [Streptomyces hygroscopicus subsp. hygroscopicus]
MPRARRATGERGLEAAVEFAGPAPRGAGATSARTAPRWIVQQPGVSSVVPGTRNPEQVRANAPAAGPSPLPGSTPEAVRGLYGRRLQARVHHRRQRW